jgi:hypothetical protein
MDSLSHRLAYPRGLSQFLDTGMLDTAPASEMTEQGLNLLCPHSINFL